MEQPLRIGILSDTHNEVGKTRTALAALNARGVNKLVHCGDVTKPMMIGLFEGWDITFVYGNIDRDRLGLTQAVEAMTGPASIGVVAELALNGTRIGVCHGHDEELLETMIESKAYDLVCHGHSHSRRNQLVGQVRIINPGALGGRCPESRSVCVLDLSTRRAEFIHV
jgi:putative phosphoesterase